MTKRTGKYIPGDEGKIEQTVTVEGITAAVDRILANRARWIC